MSVTDNQAAFLLDMCKLIQFATEQGFKVTGGELWRTQAQQRRYVETGRSKTMKSKHLDKLAIDLHFFKVIPPLAREQYINGLAPSIYKPILKPLGDFWEGLSSKNTWGGNWKTFKDAPHFQRSL